MAEHKWYQRVYCPECKQHSWTTKASPSVICSCGGSEIQGNIIVKGQTVSDEVVFKTAVSNDTGIAEKDLTVTKEPD